MDKKDINSQRLNPQMVKHIIVSFNDLAKPHYDDFFQSIINQVKAGGSDLMQSGDDSPYKNLWEEYCAQVQDEHGFNFAATEAYIQDIILSDLLTLRNEKPIIYNAIMLYFEAVVCNTMYSSADFEDTDDYYPTITELGTGIFEKIESFARAYPLN